MDSLPPQPIDSLPLPARREAYEQLARTSLQRRLGVTALEELAECAGFPSAEVMRIKLGQ